MPATNSSAVAFSFVERLAEDFQAEGLELPLFPDAALWLQRAPQSENSSADRIGTDFRKSGKTTSRQMLTATARRCTT